MVDSKRFFRTFVKKCPIFYVNHHTVHKQRLLKSHLILDSSTEDPNA